MLIYAAQRTASPLVRETLRLCREEFNLETVELDEDGRATFYHVPIFVGNAYFKKAKLTCSQSCLVQKCGITIPVWAAASRFRIIFNRCYLEERVTDELRDRASNMIRKTCRSLQQTLRQEREERKRVSHGLPTGFAGAYTGAVN